MENVDTGASRAALKAFSGALANWSRPTGSDAAGACSRWLPPRETSACARYCRDPDDRPRIRLGSLRLSEAIRPDENGNALGMGAANGAGAFAVAEDAFGTDSA